jgi:PAS domain S-box-containing protein
MKHDKQAVVPRASNDIIDALEFLTSILAASTEHCILVTDLTGTILLWNEGAHRIYGYEAREMIGQKKMDALFPLQERTPRKLLEINMLGKYGKWEGLLNQQRHNGQVFPAHITITPRYDKEKQVAGLLIISNDVSHDIVLEDLQFEELKVAQFYTRSLIEANIDILIVTDTEGIITDVNRQMCEVTGRSRADIIGSLFKTHFTDHKIAQEDIRNTLRLKTITNEELTLQSSQGKLIEVSCNATAVHGSQGQVLRILVTARDITERKTAEEARMLLLKYEQQARIIQVEANEQLQHLNELQKNFIATVSHEFRTTLTGIVGFSELLQEEREWSPAEIYEYANDINTDAQRLNRMITSLLDLGQIQSGKMGLHIEQVEMNALLKETTEHMSVATRRTILLHQDATLLFVEGDRDKLIQIMTNLLSNAVKYSPTGGDIQVTNQKDGQDVHICVKDQGMGIPKDALERIFVPYNRINSDKTRYIQGTGLGLAIVHEMIMLHGGRIWAESTLGQGSQFHFTLPLLKKISPIE